jgi:hypothetical protein
MMPLMRDTQRAKRKLAVLEARKAALIWDTESKVSQHNNSMELDLRLTDDSVFELVTLERNRELAELEVEIAKAKAASGEQHVVASVIADSRWPNCASSPVRSSISKSSSGYARNSTRSTGSSATSRRRCSRADCLTMCRRCSGKRHSAKWRITTAAGGNLSRTRCTTLKTPPGRLRMLTCTCPCARAKHCLLHNKLTLRRNLTCCSPKL